MTENEALEIIKTVNEDYFQPDNSNEFDDINESFEMAIQALEQIQEYRAIGTVEGYENAIQSSINNYNLMKEYKAKVDELEAIGTIEEFKDLKEKSVAKKPHSISIANDIGNSMVECPICHARSDYDIKSIKKGHCWRCGQKLDWSE